MLQRAPYLEDIAADPAQAIRLGRVVSVDLAQGTCIVALGDPDAAEGEAESPALPWLAPRAGAIRVWFPPAEGEQVLVLCPEGDLAGAMVLGGLFCAANPRPDSTARALIQFDDGAVFTYDPESHQADVTLPAGGSLSIIAPGGVTIEGDVVITGDVSIDGAMTASQTVTGDEDVVGGGKSLKDHRHTGVQAGGSLSGAPQ